MKTKKIRWVIAHEPIGLFQKVADRFGKEVVEKTGGKFEIEVLSLTDYSLKYGHGKKITKDDLMSLISSEKIEMSHIYTTWLADHNKDLHALDLPFLFRDHDHADKVLEGPIGASLLSGVSTQSNIKAMSFAYSGGYRIVPANFRGDTVDSWKGRKVRTSRSPVAIDMFRLLGAIPIEDISLEEMNEAADAGVIEAGESTFVRVLPLHQYKSFKVVNNTSHSLFLTSIIINQGFFKNLDAATQVIFADAAMSAARFERRESVADVPGILNQCKELGVDVLELSPSEDAKFREVTSKVYSMYEDFFSPGLVDQIKHC